MWGVSLVIPLKVFCNIRSLEKSTHLLIGSDARKANLTGIQPTVPQGAIKPHDCLELTDFLGGFWNSISR